MSLTKPTQRRSGTVRVTLYVRHDVDWDTAVRSIAVSYQLWELIQGERSKIGKAESERIIRDYLRDEGENSLAYVHEQNVDWDELYERAERVLRDNYPQWWIKEQQNRKVKASVDG